MIDYSEFFEYLRTTSLSDFAEELAGRTDEVLGGLSHGDHDRWRGAIDAMPVAEGFEVDMDSGRVAIGCAGDIDSGQLAALRDNLMEFHPWRKGPFEFFGVHIDTEWRSDLKWERLRSEIDLRDKVVLDVGCGNGYYLLRMLGAGAKVAVGVDPFLLYVMQFQAINKYVQSGRACVLPLKGEDVPGGCGCFDTVFSMGVIYHCREPEEHLRGLCGFLKGGGEVVLETIVLDTPGEELLVPEGRYAKMNNVRAIASPGLVSRWLSDCGFEDVRIVDVAKTTADEQRSTEWMRYESLRDFLDPEDDAKTIEGYPAPVRAVVTGKKCI